MTNGLDPLHEYRSGSTEPWTVNVLCALVAAKAPLVLLETGTFLGKTTLKLAEVLHPDAVLHTVDNYEAGGLVPSAVMEHPQIKVHSADAVRFIQTYDGPPFDFAFVDDDHNAMHVNEELTALRPKMAQDGLICVHDVYGPFHLNSVIALHRGVSLKLQLLHAAGGLGIIQL